MPNSLKCRLKKFVHKGLLSENDLSRLYTDNDVVEELEKIKAEIDEQKLDVDLDIGNEIIYNNAISDVLQIIDNHISELKGEQE